MQLSQEDSQGKQVRLSMPKPPHLSKCSSVHLIQSGAPPHAPHRSALLPFLCALMPFP